MKRGLLARTHGGWRAGLGVALVLAWLGCGADEPSPRPSAAEPGQEQGSPAPDFTLPDLHGRPIRLSDYRGKVVLIDFWATWCPPCVFQIPELDKLATAHREQDDVVVVGVSVDADGADVVVPWMEEHAVGYAIVCGDEELAAEFGVFGFPTLVVVGPKGEIVSRHVGLVEYDALEGLLADLGS